MNVSYFAEAVQAVGNALRDLETGVTKGLFPAEAGMAVEAAEPYIRKDEREKLEARLLSDEALGAAAREIWPLWIAMKEEQKARAIAQIRQTILAALASQETKEAPSDV